jgi:hypothetical protein
MFHHGSASCFPARPSAAYVSVAVQLNIAPRDRVRVTGELRDSFGLLQIAAEPSGMVATAIDTAGIREAIEKALTGAARLTTPRYNSDNPG